MTSIPRFLRPLFLAAWAAAPLLTHATPVPMTGTGSYDQDFDTLPTSGTSNPWTDDSTLPAWYAQRQSGTSVISASSGGSNTGGFHSFGTGTSSERAFGSIASGGTGALAFGVLLLNQSGSEITVNALKFVGEQWRNGGNTTQHKLAVSYLTSATAISNLSPADVLPTGWTAISDADFSGPIATSTAAALDGNDSANRAFINVNPNIAVPAGHYLMIRWHDPNDTGNDHGLGVDDLTVEWANAGPDTTPPVVVTYSPADDSAAAPLGADLVLTFNEPVQAGAGAVRLFSGATEVEAFTVTAGHISGNTATFNPAADLTPGSAFHVKVDAGAIKDMAGNDYPGIANDTTWNFTALTPTPPQIATLLPADNATGVAVSTSLMITFNEPVQAGAGSVHLYHGATLVESFAVAAGVISGSAATFYPAADLLGGTVYHIKIDAGAFQDLDGTPFGGIADESTWNFTTAGGADTEPPAVNSFSPAHNSTGAPVSTNLSLTFNEPVDFGGSGNLRLYVLGNPTPVKTLSVDDASIDGATATFPNDLTLAFETTYYVTLDGGTFEDLAGNPFAGISGDSTWRFTTMAPDSTPPSVVAENPVTPVHGATRVQLNTVLTITFDEAIQAGAGNILITNADGGALVAQIAANGPQVAISSTTATITPPIALPPNTTLDVEVQPGAFKDLAGNNSTAYGGSGVWSFTTVPIPELTSSGAYTQNFAGFTSAEPLTDAHVILPDGWTATGPLLGYGGEFGTTASPGGFRGTGVLGYQHSATSNVLVKTLTLINATGADLTSVTVSYLGRTATAGTQNRFPAYTVAVDGVVAPALAYSTADGDSQVRTATVTGLFVAPGALFTITWTSDKDGPGSGASKQIGITDVSVAAGTVEMPPVVAPVAITSGTLAHNSVAVTSSVIADGGAALTGRGFVFAKTADTSAPEIGGTDVTQVPDAANTVGALGATLTGLLPETQYAVRSYATNPAGTSYSAALTFTTLSAPLSLVTSYHQNFAGFASAESLDDARTLLPAGWGVSGVDFSFDGNFGAGTAGGFRGNDNVLGYQHTSNTGTLTVTVRLINDTGATIESLWISYLGRVARVAETRHPAWTVALNGSTIPELGYTTADGTDQVRTHQLSGLAIAPGEVITLSWASDRDLNASGSSRQIGIADCYVGLTEPVGGYAGWAAANAGGGEPGADFDGDGVPNGIEFFMNITTPGFTANPGVAGGVVSWPNGGNLPPSAYGTKFRVETSASLVTWDPVAADDPNLSNLAGMLSYSLKPMTGKRFARLVVEP